MRKSPPQYNFVDRADFEDMVSIEERRAGDKVVFVGKVAIDGKNYSYAFPFAFTSDLLEETEGSREWVVEFVLHETTLGIYRGLKDSINAAALVK